MKMNLKDISKDNNSGIKEYSNDNKYNKIESISKNTEAKNNNIIFNYSIADDLRGLTEGTLNGIMYYKNYYRIGWDFHFYFRKIRNRRSIFK